MRLLRPPSATAGAHGLDHAEVAVSLARAFAFVGSLREHPDAVSIAPGARHWSLFQELATKSGSPGSDTTDAYLEALAMDHGCEWWMADADFARFRT